MRNLLLLLSIVFSLLGTTAHAKVFTESWTQSGITSYYHRSLNGNKTASGERYSHMGGMTAAHRTLPFGTKIRVTDKNTGKDVVVTVNDRGPFVGKRVLDLSGMAATRLGIVKQGLCDVKIEVISLPVASKLKSKDDAILAKNTKQVKKVFPATKMDGIEQLIANGS